MPMDLHAKGIVGIYYKKAEAFIRPSFIQPAKVEVMHQVGKIGQAIKHN